MGAEGNLECESQMSCDDIARRTQETKITQNPMLYFPTAAHLVNIPHDAPL